MSRRSYPKNKFLRTAADRSAFPGTRRTARIRSILPILRTRPGKNVPNPRSYRDRGIELSVVTGGMEIHELFVAAETRVPPPRAAAGCCARFTTPRALSGHLNREDFHNAAQPDARELRLGCRVGDRKPYLPTVFGRHSTTRHGKGCPGRSREQRGEERREGHRRRGEQRRERESEREKRQTGQRRTGAAQRSPAGTRGRGRISVLIVA